MFDENARKKSFAKSEKDLMEDEQKPEALNARALAVINRVNNKLTGILLISIIFNSRT